MAKIELHWILLFLLLKTLAAWEPHGALVSVVAVVAAAVAADDVEQVESRDLTLGRSWANPATRPPCSSGH